MSGLNYLANALLIDSVDEVRNKLLAAWNYAALHRLRIDKDAEDDFNLVCKSLSDVSEEMMSYISRPIYDLCRADAVENALKVVKRAYEVIHKAEYLNDKQIEDSKESTTLLESYGEKLAFAAFAAFAAYEAIRTLGGANDE